MNPCRTMLVLLISLLLCGQAAFAAQPSGDATSGSLKDAIAVADGNNAFACDLYAQLRQTKGNLFFSPYSVSSALAMTYGGARGKTAAQLEKGLRLPFAGDRLHRAHAALRGRLDEAGKGGVQLAIANSLWPQKDYPFRDEYLALLRKYYNSSVTPVDYEAGGSAAAERINRWVEENTAGKIRDLINNVPADTRLLLVNAVYFKGDWRRQFDELRTRNEPFLLDAGAASVPVPLMYQENDFLYAEREGFQILQLPYVGKGFSMLVLLPSRAPGAMEKLEKALSAELLASLRRDLRTEKVRVFLPKFTLTWGAASLKKPLGKLGVTDVFDRRADFSGMDGRRFLFIDDVVHKAFVDVNEKGTEAAAATAAKMDIPRSISKEKEPKLFRADHPFVFLIQEDDTGAVLFMGRLSNPKGK